MSKNDIALINAVIKTLDTVQVQGRDNMMKLSNCMTVLEKIINNDIDDILIGGSSEKCTEEVTTQ